MATNRRRPIVRRTVESTDPNVPDVTEEVEDMSEDQDTYEDTADGESDAENGDIHAAGGVGQHMNGDLNTPIPPITEYVELPPPAEPDNSYVLDGENEASSDWFREDPTNSDVVVCDRDIVRKVLPMNAITPTYILLIPAGRPMTKDAVNKALR